MNHGGGWGVVVSSSPYHATLSSNDEEIITLEVEEKDVEVVEVEEEEEDVVDTRPHEQRTKNGPRTARRLNHAFRYLYRHDNSNNNPQEDEEEDIIVTAEEYLQKHGGYTKQQVQELQQMFPPLSSLDVQRHLKPKMRFLKETILGMQQQDNSNNKELVLRVLPEEIRTILPPHYYGSRLERIVAPRHAFLVYFGLPHGRDLLLLAPSSSTTTNNENNNDNDKSDDGSSRSATVVASSERWQDFLKSCRNPKSFAALCNRWAEETGTYKQERILQQPSESSSSSEKEEVEVEVFTRKQIEAFDTMFGRGLMAATRNYLCQTNNTWPLDYINITSGQMIDLLIQHGANPMERDNRGVSLLHWAAGVGNLDGFQTLLPYFDNDASSSNNAVNGSGSGLWVQTERDGATPLHWAAAGASQRSFGVGGHPEICRYILEQFPNKKPRREYVNQVTKDGNSPLMWAAWSGTLETVKFLIRNRADAKGVKNRNGCTVAHWASSGGNLEVCRYLAETVGVDFLEPNYGGNTPLTHAVAFGRANVVEWLRKEIITDEQQDDVAAGLAYDFVDWTNGEDTKRQEVLKLFEDWYRSQ